jgi:hypothetical protein
MKNSTFPKKHTFSERPRSVAPNRQTSRDKSPSRKLNNSQQGNMNNSNNNSRAVSPSSKNMYNTHQSPSTPNNQLYSTSGINMSDLTFNVNDDHKTLINKNRKLCNLLIQASNKISDFVIYVNYTERASSLQ